jgi:hypothetical protein
MWKPSACIPTPPLTICSGSSTGPASARRSVWCAVRWAMIRATLPRRTVRKGFEMATSPLFRWLHRWRQRDDQHLVKRAAPETADPIDELRRLVGKSDLLRHLSSRPWSRAVWRETCGRQSFRGRREHYRRRRPAPQGRGQGRRLDLTSCSVSHKVRRNTAIWKTASPSLERSRCRPL